MAENKISKENAESIFKLYLDKHSIKADESDDFKVLIEAIEQGKLEFKEEGSSIKVIQHLSNSGGTLEYKPLDGYAKIEMDKVEGRHSKMYSLLGYLSGEGIIKFAKMQSPDLPISEMLAVLFLS